jgi:DNA polymerase sigma
MLLKILLNQHELDKPFTGGLGSFKLYVLVANHVSRPLRQYTPVPFDAAFSQTLYVSM